MKKEVVAKYKSKAKHKDLCKWTGLNRSTSYYQNKSGTSGAKPSKNTRKTDGSIVSNNEVVKVMKSEIFSQEFNRYGYINTAFELKDMGYIINKKKVYRLMKENDLLLDKIKGTNLNRTFVKWRKIENVNPMDYLCMDIKYIYIHGKKRHAYLLTGIDVATRFAVSWELSFSIKHKDVVLMLQELKGEYPFKLIILRTDNGSQFIANGLKEYIKDKQICHEFTHISTPEENSYIESFFSIVENEVIDRYEFDSVYHAKEIFKRYFNWYNTKRRHGSLGRISPLKYWNTRFHSHPVRPPRSYNEENVKGADTFKNIKLNKSALDSPLTFSELCLTLPNRMRMY